MADRLTDEQRHRNMASIRSKDTRPEVRLCHALHHAGFRYRKNVRRLPGSPDIVLAKYRTAIFVNGCFWHGHQGCRFYTHPKSNPEFWTAKVERNQMRDAVVSAKLESLGWSVLTVWECELKKDKLDETVERIKGQLQLNLKAWSDLRERHKAEREASRERKAAAQEDAQLLSGYKIPPRIARIADGEENEYPLPAD